MNEDEIIDISNNDEPLDRETIEISSVDNNNVDVAAENVIYEEIPTEVIEEIKEDIEELQENSGAAIDLDLDSNTYELTAKLKNSDGEVVSTDTVDFPIEDMQEQIADIQEFDEEVNEILPTVSGTGTELSLDGTKEARMEIDLKGNTEQASTSGKNLLNIFLNKSSGFTRTVNDVTETYNNDGSITYNGTASAQTDFYITSSTYGSSNDNIILDITSTYTMSLIDNSNTGIQIFMGYGNQAYNTSTSKGITPGTNISWVFIRINNGTALSNFTIYPQLELGSTATDYEPYTGGISSPNPDYPQDIHTVTGNNTVSVCGKNLLNLRDETKTSNEMTSTTSNGIINLNGTATAISFFRISYAGDSVYFNLKAGTYTLSANNSTIATSSEHLRICNKNGSPLSGATIYLDKVNSKVTFTLAEDLEDLMLQVRINSGTSLTNYVIKPQLELNSTATDYEPYQGTSYPIDLGTMELCKIGDYQDEIRKSTGKNLFDKSNANILDTYISSTGLISTSDLDKCIYIPCKPNTTYTISKSLSMPTSNNKFRVATCENVPTVGSTSIDYIGYNTGTEVTSITITTSANANYLSAFIFNANSTTTFQQMLDSIQIEENSIATEYEPYGKVWYLHKEIGKVVLDGSEEGWTLAQTNTNTYRFTNSTVISNKKAISINKNLFLCNEYQKYAGNSAIGAVDEEGIAIRDTFTGFTIRALISRVTDLNGFKAWLSTHNTIVYYVLETPTNTEITDTALIAQLDAIKYSYDTQTNITQTNADLPFILTATVKKDIHLEDYVKNTDYATNDTAGVTKNGNGFVVTAGTGVPYCGKQTYEQYSSTSDNRFISKGTLENVIAGKGLVSNTDYASGSTAGVVKTRSTHCFGVSNSGQPFAYVKTYIDYPDLNTESFISKGTLENVIAGKNLDGVYYGTCTTGAGTQEKAVTCAGYRLQEGNVIYVKMTNGNTYNGVAKLNVNSTGAKDISKGADTGSRYLWSAGELVCFAYDGTNYIMTNTGLASSTYYGLTKLATSAVNTSTSISLTPASLTNFSQTMVSGYAVYSTSSTYAVGDRVRYNYGTYECITAISTAEAWNAAHWKLLDPLQMQIDNNKTYKTTETIVGEFLGKPLYRKVVNITATEYNALDTTSSRKKLPLNTDIKLILKADMVTNYNDGTKLVSKNYPMHMVNTGNSYDQGCHIYEDGFLQIYVGSAVLSGLIDDITIILEYTKTTD